MPFIQCFRCQAHGHTSANCNKTPKCVKCAQSHDTRTCSKTPSTPAKCINCSGDYPANYSKCPALLAFLQKRSKKTNPKKPKPLLTIQQTDFPHIKTKPTTHFSQFTPTPPSLPTPTHTIKSYAQATISSPPSPPPQTTDNLNDQLDALKSSDLDLFLRILDLIQIHYLPCKNNVDRVKATIQIIKKLDD